MNTEPCEYCGCNPCDCDWGMDAKKDKKDFKPQTAVV